MYLRLMLASLHHNLIYFTTPSSISREASWEMRRSGQAGNYFATFVINFVAEFCAKNADDKVEPRATLTSPMDDPWSTEAELVIVDVIIIAIMFFVFYHLSVMPTNRLSLEVIECGGSGRSVLLRTPLFLFAFFRLRINFNFPRRIYVLENLLR